MTNRFRALTVIAAAGLALTGCGGSSDSPSSSSAAATSNSAPAPASSSTSAATSASSSTTESGGGSAMGDPEKCLAAASAGLDMTSVGLDALTGDFDKAFPASTLEKVPDELKDAYQAAMDAAKALVGKSAEEAMTLSNAYTDKMTDYANQLGKVCAGQ